jgi:hypothetical protein
MKKKRGRREKKNANWTTAPVTDSLANDTDELVKQKKGGIVPQRQHVSRRNTWNKQ